LHTLLDAGLFTPHALFIALGICVSVFLPAVQNVKRKKFHPEIFFYIAPFAVLSGVLFARLMYVAFNHALFLSIDEMLDLTSGGYCLYGGVFGAALAVVLWCVFTYKTKYITDIFDAVCLYAPLAIAVGRMGSAFTDDCYGTFITNPTFCRFPFAAYVEVYESWCLSIFFFEALGCLAIWLFMMTNKKRLSQKGANTLVFFSLYAGLHTFLESLRTDSVYWGFVRISQVISALILIFIFVFMTVKLVKITKYHHIYPIVSVVFLAALIRGFTAEFFMGSSSYTANCIWLMVSCAVMTLCIFVLFWIYQRVTGFISPQKPLFVKK
jgi:phosphatidylglycerol:prolipoprotein diacylglycerol transferase